MIYALTIPQASPDSDATLSGATEFADMRGVLASLPPDEQRALSQEKVLYSQRRAYASGKPLHPNNEGLYDPQLDYIARNRPDVEHPRVRQLPETKTACLFLGSADATLVYPAGSADPTGDAEALAELETWRKRHARDLERATRPEFVTTHRWAEGDLGAWSRGPMCLPDSAFIVLTHTVLCLSAMG